MKKLIVILSAFLMLSGCSKAEEPIDVPEIKEPEAETPIAEPKPDRVVDFIAVGDNLIHGAIYYDSEVRHQGYEFDELYEEIKPYVQAADVAYINHGEIGEITHKLYDTLTGIQWGKLPDELGWTVKVD